MTIAESKRIQFYAFSVKNGQNNKLAPGLLLLAPLPPVWEIMDLSLITHLVHELVR